MATNTGPTEKFNWMALANMFMGKMKNQPIEPTKRRIQPATSKPTWTRPATHKPAKSEAASARHNPAQLHPDHIAAITRIEALRLQLLHQLVHFQNQLLALKIPVMPVNKQQQQYLAGMCLRNKKGKITPTQINANLNIQSAGNCNTSKWMKDSLGTFSFSTKNSTRNKARHRKRNCNTFTAVNTDINQPMSLGNPLKMPNTKQGLIEKTKNIKSSLGNANQEEQSYNHQPIKTHNEYSNNSKLFKGVMKTRTKTKLEHSYNASMCSECKVKLDLPNRAMASAARPSLKTIYYNKTLHGSKQQFLRLK